MRAAVSSAAQMRACSAAAADASESRSSSDCEPSRRSSDVAGLGGHRQHPLERRGVAALELREQLQPGLDVLQPARVGLEPVDEPAQLDRRVLQPGSGVAQLGGNGRHSRLVLRGGGHRLARPGGERLRALALGRAEQLGGRGCGRGQLVEVAKTRALGPKRLGLAGLHGGRIGPRHQVLQVEPVAGGIGRLRPGSGQSRIGGTALAPRASHRLGVTAGVGVEQLELARRLGEPPGLVLG